MEKTISETHQVPITTETDVLVVGGGVAGIGAALAAARNGQGVTIIEKGIVLGGLATLGHVCVYLPLCDGIGNKIFGGIAEELLYHAIKYSYNNLPAGWKMGIRHLENPEGRYRTHFNIPAFVLALDELMEKEKINVVFDAVFSEPIMDGNFCKGVIVESKSGRTAYLAKMIVDASGDADVLFRAGAECCEQKSIVSHWCYELEFARMEQGIREGNMLKALCLRWLGLRPDADNSQSAIPKFYGTSVEEVNKYIRVSRKIALEHLKKNQRPDYAMLTLPYMAQFRMTRRIKGIKQLELVADAYQERSVGCVINSLAMPAPVYEFPYEALLDAKLKNIIAAGRIVAAEGAGWEMIRLIPASVFTGQVAGTVAALAIKAGTNLHDVDISVLQKNLSATGIMIHVEDRVRGNRQAAGNRNPKKVADPLIKADALFYH
jgi:hypothetical protein